MSRCSGKHFVTCAMFTLGLVHQTWARELFVPLDFATIQGAVDAATDGDIIRIAPATYVEDVGITGKQLTLSRNGVGQVVLKSTEAWNTSLRVDEGASVVIIGLTIDNGVSVPNAESIVVKDSYLADSGNWDAALFVENTVSMYVEDSILVGSSGADGIHALNCQFVKVKNSWLEGSDAGPENGGCARFWCFCPGTGPEGGAGLKLKNCAFVLLQHVSAKGGLGNTKACEVRPTDMSPCHPCGISPPGSDTCAYHFEENSLIVAFDMGHIDQKAGCVTTTGWGIIVPLDQLLTGAVHTKPVDYNDDNLFDVADLISAHP